MSKGSCVTATVTGLKTPLRPHQKRALNSICRAFAEAYPRAQVRMPTGGGKTYLAVNAAHRIVPRGRVLVVVPTIALLYQTAEDWYGQGHEGTYLSICSQDPAPDLGVCEVLTRVCQPHELADHYLNASGALTVICTYDAVKKIEEAHQEHHLPQWDLIIVDEAHRTAGYAGKDWARILNDQAVPARHRLFMTATPRIVDRGALRDMPDWAVIASMDDERLYGPVIYSISLAEAISEGLLADYRIVAVEVTEEEVRGILRRPWNFGSTGESLRLSAVQIALLMAQQRWDLRRTLVFHNHIADAEVCAETLPATADLMPAKARGHLTAGAIHSRQTFAEQQRIKQAFIDTPLDGPSDEDGPRRSVLTNCNTFTEGVDIPSIDSIVFADPKCSSLQIVQAIGRALRQTPGQGKIAHIIIPVYVSPREKLEEGVQGTRYQDLYDVLIKLSVWDEHVIHRMAWVSDARGEERPYVPARPERADELIELLSLRHQNAPLKTWELGFEQAEAFHTAHGHLNVASRYMSETGFYLGWWVGKQRSLKHSGALLADREKALNALGITWEHPRGSIEHHLDVARDYAARYGHLVPTRTECHQGAPLGRWLADRRHELREKRLPYCYQRALNEIYPLWCSTWDRPGTWRRTYAAALSAARQGNLPFPNTTPHQDEPPLATWLGEQIQLLPTLTSRQQDLLSALPLTHPLAYLLRRPYGYRQAAFCQALRAAYLFWCRHQHLNVPFDHVHREGSNSLHLGRWLAERRQDAARLTQEQIAALEALDMRWIPRQRRSTD